MDTSALNAYVEEPTPLRPTDSKLKEEAFYTAATAAPEEEMEGMYDQLMNDFTRFGRSPLYEEIKDNWKQAREQEVSFKASEVLLNTAIPPKDKVTLIQDLSNKAKEGVSAKEAYVASISNNTEIPVIGGVPADQYDSVGPTPREDISGGLADFLLRAKKAMDQYEVKDWVPLLGGTGVGEIIVGDAAEVLDEVSHLGLGELFEYAPVSNIGGRSNPLNYKLKKGTVDAIFLGMDVAGLSSLGAQTVRTLVRKATTKAIKEGRIRIEPRVRDEPDVPIGETIYFDRDSPVGVVSRIDKPKAATTLLSASKSPKIADAMGTSPPGIISTNLLPKLDEGLQKIYPDFAAELEKLDRQTLYYFDANKVSPYLFDVSAIRESAAKNYDTHYEIMRSLSEKVQVNAASSYIEDTGRALRWNTVYGKEANKGFTNPIEAMDARDQIIKKVARNYSEELVNKPYADLSITERKKLHNKVGDKVSLFKDPDNGEVYIKWSGVKIHEPAVDTLFREDTIKSTFAGFDVTSFANTPVGQFIFEPAARLPKWTTGGFARTDIAGSNLNRVWANAMRDHVTSTKPRKELAQAIYKTEELGKNLTVEELGEMFPLGSKDFKSLVKGYFTYRRLVDYTYLVTNNIVRTQKVTAGFKGLFDETGQSVGLGRLVEPEDLKSNDGTLSRGPKRLVASDGGEVKEVYSFQLVESLDEMTKKTTKKPKGPVSVTEFDINTTDIYKLDQSLKVDGRTYEFAIHAKEGAVPTELLPKIPGYYPHENIEPYFIKGTPKTLVLNGREIVRDNTTAKVYASHAGTFGVARTEKSAQEYAKALSEKYPEYTFEPVIERLDVGNNLQTYMESVKYAQDMTKSRRAERLELPDGTLGRLEDPAVVLDKRLRQVSKLYAWKDMDFEFRRRFVERYGVLTEGVFPKSVSDLALDPNMATPTNKKLQREAQLLFEQYSKQQGQRDTFLDDPWRNGAIKVARYLEEVAPDTSELARSLSAKREPFLSTGLKLATLKWIHLNPQKQYIIQTSQAWELHALALSQGNPRFARDAANLSAGIFADSLIRNSNKVPKSFKALMRERGNIPTGYSPKEYQEILDAFYDSGALNGIDMGAMLDGVFKSTADRIDVGDVAHGLERIKDIGKGLVNLPRQVGYNPAELMNQITLWLYARSDFIKRYPNKKWNDPHNLELIAERAWGIGNTMTARGSMLPYQEGTMRAFMQFTAPVNKAIMQPYSSKYLTAGEKRRLAVIRLAAFGEKGIIALPLAIAGIKAIHYKYTEDDSPSKIAENTPADDWYRFAERGLTDLFVNKVLNNMLKPEEGEAKTDLMVSKTIALGSETNIPMGDFFRDMYYWLKGEGKPTDIVPFTSSVSSLYDTTNEFWMLLQARKWEENQDKGKAISYILKTSEFASGYSNFEKGLAMLQHDSIVSKYKGDKDIAATAAEAVGKMLGIPSYKEYASNIILRQDFRLKKHIQDSVKKAIASLHAIEDVYDGAAGREDAATLDEVAEKYSRLAERINHLSTMYADANLKEEFEEEFWRQIEKEDKNLMDGIVSRMNKRKTAGYDKVRREMFEKLNEMKRSGDKDLGTLLESLAIEIRDADKEQQ